MRGLSAIIGALLGLWVSIAVADPPAWAGFAGDAQHTAAAPAPTQSLDRIRWRTPVDLRRKYEGDALLIHYGSPVITAANTVIVPVKVLNQNLFRLEARRGTDGQLRWATYSDYLLPPHDWTPSFGPVLTPAGRLYFPGAGGTLLYRDSPDSSAGAVNRVAFYGTANYLPHRRALFTTVMVNTPLTADAQGNVFFGFQVIGPTPLGLVSGLARVSATGAGSWIAASTAAGDPAIGKVVHNAAPALSIDQRTLYVTVTTAEGHGSGMGYLLALDSQTLARQARARLKDPDSGLDARLPESGSASPTVGPDGDVYVGVLENPFPNNHDRGWLLHFDAGLTLVKVPGAFGWDDTASIVPASAVPSYHGSSAYLVMTKYNNYAQAGGDGVNRLAVLDPFTPVTDPISGATVMNEVLTIAGPTPDPDQVGQFPGAVREWCINTAAVDVATRSVIANSEDGKLYRWDLASNTLSQSVRLTSGLGEAYTPTVIGPDGTVYAIGNGILFAIGR